MQTSVELVGRQNEERELRLALSESRLVVVRGPAGVGKSRLVREALPDAVFCSLRAADTEAAVLRALADGLGGRAPDDSTSILHRLASRPTPVAILDGADRAATQLETWVRAWLDVHPETRFVITLCGGSAWVGARELQLQPLASADAVVMWTRATGRHGLQTKPHLGREIVAKLDHLPLAISWMASQAAVVGELACLERLRGFSTSGGPLSAALDAVLEHLSEEETRALATIAVFEQGALAPVLDSLLGLDLGSVGSLLERSLLRIERLADGTPRTGTYRLVALRARKQAKADGTWESLLRAHASAVLGVAEPLASRLEGPLNELGHLRVELEAIADRFEDVDPELAVRASIALAPLALRDRGSTVTADRLHRILARHPSASDGARVALAALERRLGRFDRARAQLEAVTAPGFGPVLERAHLDRMQSRSAEAHAGYEHALEIAEQSGDAPSRCVALGELGRMLQSVGQFEGAQALHQQAAGLARAMGLREREALERSLYARATHRAGTVREAIKLHEQALDLHRELGHERLVAAELGHLGFCHHEVGELSTAEVQFRQSIAGLGHVGDVMLECIERILLARLLVDLGRSAEAMLELGLAEGVLEESDVPRIRLSLHLVSGLNEIQRDDLEAARAQLREGMEYGAHIEVGFEALLPAYLAFVESRLGEPEAAASLLDSARSTLGALESRGLRTAAAMLMASASDEPVASPPADVASSSSDVRRVLGLVQTAAEPDRALRIAADGRRVRLPGGTAFEFGRHAAPRRVLTELAVAREASPGDAVSAEQLIAAGWPGERMQTEAARKRLRTAIWTLRKLGLEGILLTRDDGYLLDPYVPFAWIESAQNGGSTVA